jgi:DNA-binding PadR family transcriptional regulator
MLSLGKAFEYKGRQIKLSAHEFITLLKIRVSQKGISAYKLIGDLAKAFAGSWSPQSGTMYPILRRLADEKSLISETAEKTPIGPAVKVYKIKDDLGRVIDTVLLDNYKSDISFFGNFIEFLYDNFEQSVTSGEMPELIGGQVQAVLDDLVKKVQAVSAKFGELQKAAPAVESICPKCNITIDRIAKFCPQCGSEIKPSK